MKFEISDESLLMASGVGCAVFATTALVAPAAYQDLFFDKSKPRHDGAWRWQGHSLLVKATTDMCISVSEPNKKTVKNCLKLSGVQWLTAAAHMAYRAQARDGTQKREISVASAVGQAAMGAVLLYRGCKDDYARV